MIYAFDMGNVVIRNIEVNHKAVELLGVNPEEFSLDYEHYQFPLMDGTISVDAYYRHLEAIFGIKVPGAPFSDLFEPVFNEPMVKVIEKLKVRGNRIICVSNTFQPHWDVIQGRKLDKYFDKVYLSHEIGITKPSPLCFKRVLREENVEAKDVMFTDDREENVVAAGKLGMKTFLYSFSKTEEELKKAFSL